jgi:hypothetical protein
LPYALLRFVLFAGRKKVQYVGIHKRPEDCFAPVRIGHGVFNQFALPAQQFEKLAIGLGNDLLKLGPELAGQQRAFAFGCNCYGQSSPAQHRGHEKIAQQRLINDINEYAVRPAARRDVPVAAMARKNP